LAKTRSDIPNCEVSPETLDGHDSSQDFLSPYFDLAAAALIPSIHSTPLGASQAYSSQTVSISSSSPSTYANASYSATPQQVQARYPCELCLMAFDRILPLAEHYKDRHSPKFPGTTAT
jgi:hypothetical protein